MLAAVRPSCLMSASVIGHCFSNIHAAIAVLLLRATPHFSSTIRQCSCHSLLLDPHLILGECRDLTSFDLAPRLLTEKPNSRFENFVHESVQLGSKAIVSAGCIVGKGSILGDRCSVKRSIIGSTCKLGNSVKIVSSIVMDDVIIEDGSHIQNSIICSESHLQVRNLTLLTTEFCGCNVWAPV